MTFHVRLEVAKKQMWMTIFMCMKKKKTCINFKFWGIGGQSNKVLETLINKNNLNL